MQTLLVQIVCTRRVSHITRSRPPPGSVGHTR